MTKQNILKSITLKCIPLKMLRSIKPLPAVLIFVFVLLRSCREEEPVPVAIQFSSSEQAMMEGSQAQVSLVLKVPAKVTGTIELRVSSDAIYGQHYATTPETIGNKLTLSISRGQKIIQFYITALDNSLFGPNRGVVFGIENVSAGFMINAPSTLSVSIANDEGPLPSDFSGIRVNFGGYRGSIPETQSSGISIKVGLSKYIEGAYTEPAFVPAVGNGEVQIKFTSGHATYGKEFITEPPATAGEILLKFDGTQTDTTFTVIPIDNSDLKGNRYISVSLNNVTGDIEAGGVVNYLLEILDDEAGEGRIRWTKLNTRFADLRSVEFFDENSGYVVSSNALYRTDDGGISWSSIDAVNGNEGYFNAHFLNETVGFASGTIYSCYYDDYYCFANTHIFRTVDGGTWWHELGWQHSASVVTSMYFLSESTGVIGTANGEILKTANGGATWIQRANLFPASVNHLFIFSNGTGYAVAGNRVLKTTDAGDSWVSAFATPNDADIISLSYSSTNTLYASWSACSDLPDGFRVIYKSEDGVNWTPASECLIGGTLDFSSTTNLGISLGAIYWNGWLSEFHLSVDNGSSWIPEPLPPDNQSIRDIDIAPNGVIYAIDGDGQFLLKGVVE